MTDYQKGTIDCLLYNTQGIMTTWCEIYEKYGSEKEKEIFMKTNLNIITDLTHCLNIWDKKGTKMTQGELVLARVNLGALVECWLKFFYCIYYEQYEQEFKGKKNPEKITSPEKMTLEKLKTISRGSNKLWTESGEMDKWVTSIQEKRNYIHAFGSCDNLGTAEEFFKDIAKYSEFMRMIDNKLPDIIHELREPQEWKDLTKKSAR